MSDLNTFEKDLLGIESEPDLNVFSDVVIHLVLVISIAGLICWRIHA